MPKRQTKLCRSNFTPQGSVRPPQNFTIMAIQTNNKAAMAHRLDQQTYKGKIRKDPPNYITCTVRDERKSFTITFNPALLSKKIEKYGDKLILPSVKL